MSLWVRSKVRATVLIRKEAEVLRNSATHSSHLSQTPRKAHALGCCLPLLLFPLVENGVRVSVGKELDFCASGDIAWEQKGLVAVSLGVLEFQAAQTGLMIIVARRLCDS